MQRVKKDAKTKKEVNDFFSFFPQNQDQEAGIHNAGIKI